MSDETKWTDKDVIKGYRKGLDDMIVLALRALDADRAVAHLEERVARLEAKLEEGDDECA